MTNDEVRECAQIAIEDAWDWEPGRKASLDQTIARMRDDGIDGADTIRETIALYDAGEMDEEAVDLLCYCAAVLMSAPGTGTLYNYRTGEPIRDATIEEEVWSIEATVRDGGLGLILVNGTTCYVQ